MALRRENEVLDLAMEFRRAQREIASDYYAGKDSRFLPRVQGIASSGSGADYHYRNEWQYLYMIERAREFDRNNLVVAQGINRLVANIMQDGFTLDVQTPDPKLNEALGAQFWDWANDPDQCDDEQERDFGTLAELALRHSIVDGDCLGIPLEDGPLLTVEGHRLRKPSVSRNPNMMHGILFDGRRRRKEYWVTKEEINPLLPVKSMQDVQKYPARDKEGTKLLHIYDPKRFSQSRGVTAFATLVYALSLHDDIQFATLIKQQVASAFAIIHEIEDRLDGPPEKKLDKDPAAQTGKQTVETLEDGSERTRQGIAPGMRIRSKPGEKIKGFAPNIPSPEFFTHANLILTFVSINLDLPLQVFLLDPTKTNFSGWRGAIDQARLRFRRIQRFLISKFHKPLYEWRCRRALRGDAALKKLYEMKSGKYEKSLFAHRWNPATWKYIQPREDAEADTIRKNENLAPARLIASEKGEDYDDQYKACVDDRVAIIRYAATKAAELNEDATLNLGDNKVTWRDLSNIAPPGTVKAVDPNARIQAQNTGGEDA